MSKWLRRGFAQNNSSEAAPAPNQGSAPFQYPPNDFPAPPRNEAHPQQQHGAYFPSSHPFHHNNAVVAPAPLSEYPPPESPPQEPAASAASSVVPQTMVGGYSVQLQQASPSSANPSTIAAMDLDPRHKFSNANSNTVTSQLPPFGSVTSNMMKQDPSGRILDERARGRSTGSAARMDRNDRSRSRPHSQPQQQQFGASPPQPPPQQQAPQYHPAQPHHRGPPPHASGPLSTAAGHFGPPPTHALQQQHPSYIGGKNGVHTPMDSAQPTYPPPAVTADSTQPSEGGGASRRPAYLLHRDLVIGKGSYGQVCIASRGESEGHQARSGKRKKFACKCVMLRNDPKYIAKLQEEVNVLRELRGHENVIRLYDVFCVDNELFIITELGRGGDLFHLLTTHPKHGVTEAYAAKTVAEMLSAVAFLHCRSICHRDLKLENWVLESGKDVWSPLKLIDFGLSTHFTRGQRLSRVVGSSYYVAPEVLKKSYTEACDLWSLGVIVYMLLSGAPPFYGKNDEAIKASIVQGEYTFPQELFRDVSDEAMAFVSTLLSYNIDYRYTADQALTHPWLSGNCEPLALKKAKDGARGIGLSFEAVAPRTGGEPMQM